MKEGKAKDEGDYVSNFRYSDIASPELVKKPKAQALLQKICHGAMALSPFSLGQYSKLN